MEEIEIRVRPTDDNRYIVLIIYDITDNKRRLSMVRCLEQFAVRVPTARPANAPAGQGIWACLLKPA